MNSLLWNLLLALAWVAATGKFTPANFAAGFVLGFLVMFFTRHASGSPDYAVKAWRAVELFAYFLWEMLLANLRVAYDVLTPQHHMRPGVIGIPLDAKTDLEILLLSGLISLTPGTLALDVSADRSTLYLHVMYLDDIEQMRARIKQGFERRLLEVTR